MNHRHLLAGAFALMALLAVPGSAAATPSYSLRVEAPGATLDPGTRYSVRSPIGAPRGETLANGNCARGQGRIPLAGRTALGLAATAFNATKALRPVWVVEDGFGRRICRIASFNETDTPFTGWLYRVNHVAPPVSAELAPLKHADEVLWVFADFGSGTNTGDELVLDAPIRTAPGSVEVSVSSVSFDGTVTLAADGTTITGGASPVTTAGGKALVPIAPGVSFLRATADAATPTEIASSSLSVCASANPADCPAKRGLRIVGTNLKDRFKGGAGPDVIRTRGGRDKVRVRGGGRDVVKCGKGRDFVIADASDKLRKCEKVKRV
jgi:Ca2+-binding RTX toxin-like protein